MSEFQPWPKMARWSRDIIVTEKIDGTNSQVYIYPANEIGMEGLDPRDPWAVLQEKYALAFKDGMAISAGSRTRWLDTSSKGDNFGFAKWVEANAEELFKLGEGRHFGEWWGKGIQRGYGMDDKYFSLFNVGRWYDDTVRPACCDVVPVLYDGPNDEGAIDRTLFNLARGGSEAAPGYRDPEGIIIWHTAANVGFKKTIKDDEKPKGQVNV